MRVPGTASANKNIGGENPHRGRRMSDRRTAKKAEEHRSPLNNLESEQALLGALLVNNDALHLVATRRRVSRLDPPAPERKPTASAGSSARPRARTAPPPRARPAARTGGGGAGRRPASPLCRVPTYVPPAQIEHRGDKGGCNRGRLMALKGGGDNGLDQRDLFEPSDRASDPSRHRGALHGTSTVKVHGSVDRWPMVRNWTGSPR